MRNAEQRPVKHQPQPAHLCTQAPKHMPLYMYPAISVATLNSSHLFLLNLVSFSFPFSTFFFLLPTTKNCAPFNVSQSNPLNFTLPFTRYFTHVLFCKLFFFSFFPFHDSSPFNPSLIRPFYRS